VKETLEQMVQIKPLKEIRKEHILQVLRSTHGDLDRASRILGITAASLRRMIKEQGISLGDIEHNRGS